MRGEQLTLIEPTGREVPHLAMQHIRRAKQCRDMAAIWRARGHDVLASACEADARAHDEQSVCLGMLAEFEILAGLVH